MVSGSRHELVQSISRGGPLGPARKLQQMQRDQLLRIQRRRMENPRPFERRIHSRLRG